MVLTDFKNKIEIKDPENNAVLLTENITAGNIAGFRVGVNGPEYKEYTDTTWKKIIDPEVVGIFLGGVPVFEDLPVTVDDAEIIWPGKKISVDDYCIVNKDETHEDDPAFYIIDTINGNDLTWNLLAVLDIDITNKLDKGFADNSVMQSITFDQVTPDTELLVKGWSVSTDGLDTKTPTPIPFKTDGNIKINKENGIVFSVDGISGTYSADV